MKKEQAKKELVKKDRRMSWLPFRGPPTDPAAGNTTTDAEKAPAKTPPRRTRRMTQGSQQGGEASSHAAGHERLLTLQGTRLLLPQSEYTRVLQSVNSVLHGVHDALSATIEDAESIAAIAAAIRMGCNAAGLAVARTFVFAGRPTGAHGTASTYWPGEEEARRKVAECIGAATAAAGTEKPSDVAPVVVASVAARAIANVAHLTAVSAQAHPVSFFAATSLALTADCLARTIIGRHCDRLCSVHAGSCALSGPGF